MHRHRWIEQSEPGLVRRWWCPDCDRVTERRPGLRAEPSREADTAAARIRRESSVNAAFFNDDYGFPSREAEGRDDDDD